MPHGSGENPAVNADDSIVRRDASTGSEVPQEVDANGPAGSTVLWNAGGGGERPGDWIGPYKLLSKLGEGAYGVVWLAERREPHVQRVALKVIKPGMDSQAVIARFEQERQGLAVMDHPNVAKVYDAGTTSMGRPYFVMEAVQPESITAYCDRCKLTIKQRLELFIPVCEAVQHAHHKGIIHRDIKPSNVLVTVKDDQPIPKVIDFGVAKAMAQTLTDKSIYTEPDQPMGTIEYMSPEQTGMGGIDVDARTDVYSLGVLLYELLTGVLPFDSDYLRSKVRDEVRRIIREDEPPSPSTALRSGRFDTNALAQKRGVGTKELSNSLKRELEWIPLKAMRKDRIRRYATPKEFADDLRNYLVGRPLQAGPESEWYRLKKTVRKYYIPLGAAGMGALLMGLALSTVSGRGIQAPNDVHISFPQVLMNYVVAYAFAFECSVIALKLVTQASTGRELTFMRAHRAMLLLLCIGIAAFLIAAIIMMAMRIQNPAIALPILLVVPICAQWLSLKRLLRVNWWQAINILAGTSVAEMLLAFLLHGVAYFLSGGVGLLKAYIEAGSPHSNSIH